MNKYLLVKPSEFWRYDEVNIEGEYPHVTLDDFNLEEEEMGNNFNYLFFEVPCKERTIGKTKYSNEATEIFTNRKFHFEIIKNEMTGEEEILVYSDELGLYLTKPLVAEEVFTKSSKVSGLVNYLKGHEELFKKYSYCLDTTLTNGAQFSILLYAGVPVSPNTLSALFN